MKINLQFHFEHFVTFIYEISVHYGECLKVIVMNSTNPNEYDWMQTSAEKFGIMAVETLRICIFDLFARCHNKFT